MLVVLSPAKSLDFESPLPTSKYSQPRLLERSSELIEILRARTVPELASLMSISDELALLNHQRYQDFTPPFTRRNSRPAVLAFSGDVYRGMNAAARFDERDFTEAQKTIRILSGLYGLLRPLDLIQPYRLEMGTRLANARGTNLYDFWTTELTGLLKDDLADSPGPKVLINLASQEYFGAIDPELLAAEIISPRFEDISASGQRRVIAVKAKRARGEMASWLVRNRIRSVSRIRQFAEAGYRYDPVASTRTIPVFVADGLQ